MSTRTMTMFTHDVGLPPDRASPLLRVTKPASHLLDAVGVLTNLVGEAAERGVTAIVGWHRRRRAYAELAQLDDHLLRDIGLSRDSLPTQVALLRAEQRRRSNELRRF